MGYFIIGGLLFLILSIVTALIGGLLYLIYLPFKKHLLNSGKLTINRSRQINKAYVLTLLIISASQTYFAFFPTDSFYIEEFENNAGIKLPSSANIISKKSEYPDLHGDYASAAIIELDQKDYQRAKENISKNLLMQIDTNSKKIGITSQYFELTKEIKESQIEVVYSNINRQWFKVAFLKDKKTIIFERSSS